MAGSFDVGPGATPDPWGLGEPARPAAPSQWDEPQPPGRGPGATPSGVTHPPTVWLLAGLLAAAVGLALPLLERDSIFSVAGWVLGGLVAIGLLGVFSARDLKRRTRGIAAESQLADWLRRLLVLLAIAAVALNAWVIADAIARGNW